MEGKKETHPQDTATSNTSLDVIHFSTWLVDIKGSNNNHIRRGPEVPFWNGDLIYNVFANHINIVLELSRNWHDGSSIGNSPLHNQK